MQERPIDLKDPRRNAILGALPDDEYERLLDHGEVVHSRGRDSVYDAGGTVAAAYFPLDCVFSFVAIVDGETVIESATIGYEGMVGLPLILGARTTPNAAFCQISGSGVCVAADDLLDVVGEHGTLSKRLQRYTQAHIVQLAQNVACNRLHTTDERACRWLLMTHDRVGRDEFDLTQEFFAQMLGVRRATVSLTAGILQRAGLIRYRRGIVTIVDRDALLDAACDCYGILRAEFENVM
jgi:CRP-like cAMP-binding protein